MLNVYCCVMQLVHLFLCATVQVFYTTRVRKRHVRNSENILNINVATFQLCKYHTNWSVINTDKTRKFYILQTNYFLCFFRVALSTVSPFWIIFMSIPPTPPHPIHAFFISFLYRVKPEPLTVKLFIVN